MTVTNGPKEALLTIAAEWFQHLREGEPTAEAITAWLAWLAADPAHERVYRDVQELWMLAGDAGIEEWPNKHALRDDGYGGEVSVSVWNAEQDARNRQQGLESEADRSGRFAARSREIEGDGRDEPRSSRMRSVDSPAKRLTLARAASVLLGIGALWMTWQPSPIAYAARVFTTERGSSAQFEYPDGSIVTLGAASTLRMAYGPKRRELFLEAGEAFFRVHHDKTVPFVVHSGGMMVTAVGTAFNVRADADSTVVGVTEGVVKIDAEGERSVALVVSNTHPTDGSHSVAQPQSVPASLQARAGEEISIDAANHIAVQATTAAVTLGWMEGSLTFFDEPLSVVIARLNRNNVYAVVVADPRVAELRFTGTVFKNQVTEWVSGLDRVFPVRSVVRSDGSVMLVPAVDTRH